MDNNISLLKEYNLSYDNKVNREIYSLVGTSLDLEKNTAFKNFKVKTKGDLGINNQKYISYDVSMVPNIEKFPIKKDFDFINVFKDVFW